jgi:hypothetical protein
LIIWGDVNKASTLAPIVAAADKGCARFMGQDAPVHRATSYRFGRRMIGDNESRFSEKTVPH